MTGMPGMLGMTGMTGRTGDEDSDEDWIVLKQSLISDPEKSETWKALADYFASRGNNGRSEACNDAADALS